MTLQLQIPTPPSSNHRLIVRNGRAILAPEHRRWMKAAVEAIRAQLPRGWRPLEGPVKLNVRVQVPGLSSDVSNRLKSIEDACTEAGVWLDDRQVSSILALKEFGPRGGCETVLGVSEAFDGEMRARLLEAEKRAAKAKPRPRKAKGVIVSPNVRREP